jgi:hypothetical protein
VSAVKEIGAGRGKLYGALKEVRLKWDATSDVWNDPVRHEFEAEVWEPLDEHAAAALRGIDRLSQIFVQIRQECE